jgi:DNA-binding CsgD family transcriptional regulator/PAS domain-containing protein
MSFDEADFNELVDLIYEAPFDFGLWPDVLHRISRSVNAKGGLLLPGAAPTALFASASRDIVDVLGPYASVWGQYDFMRKPIVERTAHGAITQLDFLSQQAIDRLPYFQEFRRPHGMEGLICYFVEANLPSSIAISFQLDYGKARLSDVERSRCDSLCRHVARAVRIAAHLAESSPLRSGLIATMQSLTIGLAIVDARQRIVFANQRFENLGKRGLRIVNRRLVAEHPVQQPRLERMLAGAFEPPRAPSLSNSIALRRSLVRPLLVQVIPLQGMHKQERDFAALVDRRLALVVATDPDEALPTGESSLLALGLTRAEARVARLIGGGLSPTEAAAKLENAEGTVRTLLKRVYSKIGLERQSQLAKLVARLTLVE